MRALNYSLILRLITARFLKFSRLPAFSHPQPRDGRRWSHGGRCPHVLLPGWRWCVLLLSPAVVNVFFYLIGFHCSFSTLIARRSLSKRSLARSASVCVTVVASRCQRVLPIEWRRYVLPLSCSQVLLPTPLFLVADIVRAFILQSPLVVLLSVWPQFSCSLSLLPLYLFIYNCSEYQIQAGHLTRLPLPKKECHGWSVVFTWSVLLLF